MIVVLVLLWMVFAGLILLVRVVGLDAVLMWLSEGDKWYSPLRRMPSGGHVVFYTKGWEPGGDFGSLLHGYIPQWHYHDEDERFYRETDPEFKEKFPDGPPKPRTAWERRLNRLGIGRVGFWRQRYGRARQWKAYDLMNPEAGPNSKYGLMTKETKKGEEHIFYFSTSMGVGLDKVPARRLGSVNGSVVFNTLLINPAKAEFGAGKWETRAVSAVRTRAREYIGRKDIDELREERDTDNRDDFVDHILLANEQQVGESGTVGLVPQYGVKVEGPSFEDFDYVEDEGAKEIVDARRREEVAIIDLRTEGTKAEQAKVRGEGKAKEREAEAPGIESTVKAWGSHPVGRMVVIGEAIKNGNLRALGGDILATVDTEDKGEKEKK